MLSDLLTKTTPKYPIKLYSKEETFYFRPFVVKEEKNLLIALEENDEKVIIKAIADIISSCCENVKNPLELPIYDVEYLFLNIRAKSVGEVIDLNFKDKETGEIINKSININDIKLSNTVSTEEIKINDNLKVYFRHPILKDFLDENINYETLEGYYNLIAKCLVKIETPEESIDTKTHDLNEVKDFLESMNKTQFNKILNFFNKIPSLSYSFTYENSKGTKKDINLKGLKDFFEFPSVTLG